MRRAGTAEAGATVTRLPLAARLASRSALVGVALAAAAFARIAFGASDPAALDPARATALAEIDSEIDLAHYELAERLARQELQVVGAQYGPSSLGAASVMDRLSDVLRARGELRSAETRALADSSLAIRERLLEPDDARMASSLTTLGRLALSLNRNDEAEPYLKRSLAIRQKRLGPDDPLLGRSLGDLAQLAYLRADYVQTKALARQAIEVYERALGVGHPKVARQWLTIAFAEFGEGHVDECLRILDRAYAMYEAAGRAEHAEVGTLFNSRGACYVSLAKYAEAKAALLRSIEIYEKTLGPSSLELTRPLTSLGNVHRRLGEFSEALRLQERALAIAEHNYGEEHPLVAQLLNNLAGVYWELGAIDDASRYAERAHAIRERMLPPDHPELAQSYRSLGILKQERGEREEAERLYHRALEIYERALGPSHPEVALVFFKLATLLRDEGRIQEALEYCTRGVEIGDHGTLRNHPDHAADIETRADLLARNGRCAEALSELARARQIMLDALGADHPALAQIELSRARLAASMGRDDEALSLSLQVEAAGRKHLLLTARELPERVALDYQRIRQSGLDVALSVAARRTDDEAIRSTYDALVRSRGLVLEEMLARRRTTGSNDAALTAAHQRAVERWAGLLLRGAEGEPEEYRAELDSARAEKDRAETALLRANADLRDEFDRANSGLKEVVAALPDSAALLSFVRSGQLNAPEAPGACAESKEAAHYLCFILLSGEPEPYLLSLGAADEIDRCVESWRGEADRPPGRSDAAARDASYAAAATALSDRIWRPVRDLLGARRRVFVVADGALHGVTFAAFPGLRERFLIEEGYRFQSLNSERELLPQPGADRAGAGLLALADPDYDARLDGRDGAGNSSRTTNSPASAGASGPARALGLSEPFRGAPCPELDRWRWSRLPRTDAEVDEAAKIWSRRAQRDGAARGAKDSRILRGARASEAAFKAEAPGREVLHLATHGFMLGADCGAAGPGERGMGGLVGEGSGEAADSDTTATSLLGVSGLVLAGANRRSAASTGADDGILSAEEIGALDLRGVRWAVLSACQTGLGEARSGEGILGLRRSLQVAGVRTVIMSLWSIDDESTADWMRLLYDARFREGDDSMTAVAEASRRSLAERRRAHLSDHPFYWAAFASIGDWH